MNSATAVLWCPAAAESEIIRPQRTWLDYTQAANAGTLVVNCILLFLSLFFLLEHKAIIVISNEITFPQMAKPCCLYLFF
jgi:hypothetical protein